MSTCQSDLARDQILAALHSIETYAEIQTIRDLCAVSHVAVEALHDVAVLWTGEADCEAKSCADTLRGIRDRLIARQPLAHQSTHKCGTCGSIDPAHSCTEVMQEQIEGLTKERDEKHAIASGLQTINRAMEAQLAEAREDVAIQMRCRERLTKQLAIATAAQERAGESEVEAYDKFRNGRLKLITERDELKAELAKERAEVEAIRAMASQECTFKQRAWDKCEELEGERDRADDGLRGCCLLLGFDPSDGEGTSPDEVVAMVKSELESLRSQLAEWQAVAMKQREALETARIYIEALDCACAGNQPSDGMEPCTRCMMVGNIEDALSIDPSTALLEALECAWKDATKRAREVSGSITLSEHNLSALWLASEIYRRAGGSLPG